MIGSIIIPRVSDPDKIDAPPFVRPLQPMIT